MKIEESLSIEKETGSERADSGYEGRRRKDEHDNERYRHRNMDDRDREHDRGPKPSTSRHSPGPKSRSPSRSRSKSPSPEKDKDKGKPNFNQSGLLAAVTNMVRHADGTSTVLKYNEPAEARKPPVGWRLYVFKERSKLVHLLHIHRQSCYLIGRDKAVVDIYIEHPSCSKQHAVIQHRQVQQKDDIGVIKGGGQLRPFIIDLESTNGTHVNDEAIPVSRYYELKMGDIIKFGQSTREYVLLHDDA
ncbi:SMAD/FHA domain-containing protein [Phellopilus nigrolimitatus]|nr:SMAD/FHA domain-containing protein [Phellopilus nigrolimitatus]